MQSRFAQRDLFSQQKKKEQFTEHPEEVIKFLSYRFNFLKCKTSKNLKCVNVAVASLLLNKSSLYYSIWRSALATFTLRYFDLVVRVCCFERKRELEKSKPVWEGEIESLRDFLVPPGKTAESRWDGMLLSKVLRKTVYKKVEFMALKRIKIDDRS